MRYFRAFGIWIDTDIETDNNVTSGINKPTCILTGFDKIESSNLNSSLQFYEVGNYSPIGLIKCKSPYPLDFEYESVSQKIPELRVHFFNTFEDPTKSMFHLWIFHKPLEKASSSGKYTVILVDDPNKRTSIYVFDAKNTIPQLLKINADAYEHPIINNESVTIGCKSNVFENSVLLFRYHRTDVNKQMEQIGPSKSITYDPSRGFTWNTSGQSHDEEEFKKFTYVCICKNCSNETNSIEFQPASNSKALLSSRKTKNDVDLLTISVNIINGKTQIVCVNVLSEAPIITNVYAENPRQLSLNTECFVKVRTLSMFKKNYCQEKRTIGTSGDTAILRTAHSHGLALCSDKTDESIKISREYFRGTNDVIYYDWNVALNSTDALIKIQCLNNQQIYANLNYNFTCAFVSYILSPPSFFQLHYRNGSNVTFPYESDGRDRSNGKTRHLSFTLSSNISKVSCSSLPWNSSVFINSSMDITLRDKRPPEFKTRYENQKFLLKSTNNQLDCSADGDELPEMSWEKGGMMFNETSVEIKHEPGRSILIFPLIGHQHKGVYKCKAVNSVGQDTKLYNVDVENPNEISDYGLLAGTLSGVLVILFMTILAAYFVARCYYKKKLHLTQQEIKEFQCGAKAHTRRNSESDASKVIENIHSGPYDAKFEIHSSQFQIDRSCILGSGQFGIVFKGLYNHEPVAVKTLKPHREKIYLKALLSELKVMIYINGHQHIVNLIGANTESLNKGEIYMFVELCTLGSLEGFLRTYQNNFVNQISADSALIRNGNVASNSDILCTQDLILWSNQISSGMEYLAFKKVIHGDLATRNILLSTRGSVKISDFGLAKRLYDYAIYERKNQVPLPWRWMAIESLQNWTFSTKSDVWAYGVTLWEIFTLANVPYPGLSWSPDFVKQLQLNMRMSQPNYACNGIYDIMLRCWEIDPNARPSFESINQYFTRYMMKFSTPLTEPTT